MTTQPLSALTMLLSRHTRRREFITLLGGAAAGWPLVVHVARKQPHVAVLTLLSVADEGGRVSAFIAGMRELGYVPGQTLAIAFRYAEGETERRT